MRRNLVLLSLALLGAFFATEYNRYSQCREWRLQLALREEGVMPERSWGGAAVDFLAGDLIAVGKKWQCEIEINSGEAAWAAVEAATIVPAVGAAAAWILRTAGRGFAEIAAAMREVAVLRGAAGFVRSPMALLGKITARRLPMLLFGGALLAVYLAQGQLLLDALALLPWPLQWALWTILFFCMAQLIWFAAQATAVLCVALRALWSRLLKPRLVAQA
jgi:hypothetical protein